MDNNIVPSPDMSVTNDINIKNTNPSVASLPEINRFPSTKPEPIPDEVKKYVELIIDPNLTLEDVDIIQGLEPGTTRMRIKTYKKFRNLVEYARDFAIKEAGLNKAAAFKAYGDALEAERGDGEGGREEDHNTRIKAADRILTILGEKLGSGGNTNIVIDNRQEISQDVRNQIIMEARKVVVGGELGGAPEGGDGTSRIRDVE